MKQYFSIFGFVQQIEFSETNKLFQLYMWGVCFSFSTKVIGTNNKEEQNGRLEKKSSLKALMIWGYLVVPHFTLPP